MPEAETYMPLMEKAICEAHELVWIRVRSHPYRSSHAPTLERTHVFIEEALSKGINGVVLTGAPVERKEFSEVHYWQELTQILDDLSARQIPLLGLCWGAMALGFHFFQIPKVNCPHKVFGVFVMDKVSTLPIFDQLDDVYSSAHSRNSSLCPDAVNKKVQSGEVFVLDSNAEIGIGSVISSDLQIWMIQGHPEYHAHRFQYEYRRDVALLGETQVQRPVNYDVNDPKNVWGCNGRELFRIWCQCVQEKHSLFKENYCN